MAVTNFNYNHTGSNIFVFSGNSNGRNFVVTNVGDGAWLRIPYDSGWLYEDYITNLMCDMTMQEKIDVLNDISETYHDDDDVLYIVGHAIETLSDMTDE